MDIIYAEKLLCASFKTSLHINSVEVETPFYSSTEAPLASLDNNKQSNDNENEARSQCRINAMTPATSTGGGEVRLRDRRRRESAPVIAVQDLDQGHPAGPHCQQVRGARRVSKGSQRAILTSCLSEDSALEGLESIGDIHTPKGSRRNFIELMMSTSPQVGVFFFIDFLYLHIKVPTNVKNLALTGSQVADQPWAPCPRLPEERR